jgi:hypothetical protein
MGVGGVVVTQVIVVALSRTSPVDYRYWEGFQCRSFEFFLCHVWSCIRFRRVLPEADQPEEETTGFKPGFHLQDNQETSIGHQYWRGMSQPPPRRERNRLVQSVLTRQRTSLKWPIEARGDCSLSANDTRDYDGFRSTQTNINPDDLDPSTLVPLKAGTPKVIVGPSDYRQLWTCSLDWRIKSTDTSWHPAFTESRVPTCKGSRTFVIDPYSSHVIRVVLGDTHDQHSAIPLVQKK